MHRYFIRSPKNWYFFDYFRSQNGRHSKRLFSKGLLIPNNTATFGKIPRHAYFYDRDEVREAIVDHCNGAASCGGYRAVWHALRLKGLLVPRNIVAEIYREIDPAGTVERRENRLQRRRYVNPGPNFAWHVDGYDKLKPYGFPIHGCIDGFSRRVIWLKVSRTNNDPAVVAGFFLEAVQKSGCPTILRTDNGTENTTMASVQSYFRAEGQDEHAGICFSYI